MQPIERGNLIVTLSDEYEIMSVGDTLVQVVDTENEHHTMHKEDIIKHCIEARWHIKQAVLDHDL